MEKKQNQESTLNLYKKLEVFHGGETLSSTLMNMYELALKEVNNE